MEQKTCYLSIQGQQFHYLEFGDSDLPPAIFLHGTGLHAWIWRAYADVLKDRFSVFALDQRGHGDSTKELKDYGWPNMAEDVVLFLEELRIQKPIVVGHSMGGAVALLAEALHPGSLESMVLIDPIVLPRSFYEIPASFETQPMAAKSIKRRPIWDSREQMIDSYRTKLPFKTWRADQLEDYVNHGTDILEDGRIKLKCPPEIEAQCYMGSQAMDPWPFLPQIQTPTLILRGTASNTAGLVDSAGIAAKLPYGSFVEIPDASHFVPMEEPERITEEIIHFCSGRNAD